jgi:hypothetical protein
MLRLPLLQKKTSQKDPSVDEPHQENEDDEHGQDPDYQLQGTDPTESPDTPPPESPAAPAAAAASFATPGPSPEPSLHFLASSPPLPPIQC